MAYRKNTNIDPLSAAIGTLIIGGIALLGTVVTFLKEHGVSLAVIAVLFLVGFVAYLIISKKIKKQRTELLDEILQFLDLEDAVYDLPEEYDDEVIVKSKQTLDNYDEAKYLKEHKCFDNVKDVVTTREGIKKTITRFLADNDFTQRKHYKYVADTLEDYMQLADGYIVKVIYVTSAGNERGDKTLCFSKSTVNKFEKHPEYLMTKGEYSKLLKQQAKEELENKKHAYYDKVNSIIDFVNSSKDTLIVKSRTEMLDNLVQQLFDRTVNSIQKIKQIDSDEWSLLDNVISDIDKRVHEIIDGDNRIRGYYESKEFKTLKKTCDALNISRKDFNEYIEEKTRSISKLFGTRVVRNETQNEDTFNYIRQYHKSITPFTAEVSAAVFASAENNPIDYIIKYFYPNKSQYKEQIQRLRTLIEELETLKEAKVIIDNYKKDYDQYIRSVPAFVLKDDESGFYSRLGLATIDEAVLNVEYKFVYTSAGGMAQRSFTVPMNEENIIELINRLEDKQSLQAQTKEQRALMTAKLRNYIKKRDNYTCCQCGNSIYKEPNLLLEVDHIKPIAKGGFTTEDNLQTLCWKCNRSKGAKLL